jgi:hypothetical protein
VLLSVLWAGPARACRTARGCRDMGGGQGRQVHTIGLSMTYLPDVACPHICVGAGLGRWESVKMRKLRVGQSISIAMQTAGSRTISEEPRWPSPASRSEPRSTSMSPITRLRDIPAFSRHPWSWCI